MPAKPRPNPKDKKDPSHQEKTARKTFLRGTAVTETTRRLNRQSTLSCTPNNRCAQNIEALLRISKETNQLARSITELNTALESIPDMHNRLTADLFTAADKFRTEDKFRIEKFMHGTDEMRMMLPPTDEVDVETNPAVNIFFLGANAGAVQTSPQQSEASIFYVSIYEKRTKEYSEFEKQFAQFKQRVAEYEAAKNSFDSQLKTATSFFAEFELLTVSEELYNDPKRPAEQKVALEAHTRNLERFEQNAKTFEQLTNCHTTSLAIVKRTLDEMEVFIEQRKPENLTKSTQGSGGTSRWALNWIEQNYARLFKKATREVNVDFSAATVTWANFLSFLAERLDSSIQQTTQFEKYSDQTAAAQCRKTFKFEEKSEEDTQALKEILRFTYSSNLDFYTKVQEICKDDTLSVATKYNQILALVKGRKKSVVTMLTSLPGLNATLAQLVENFMLSNLRGGIKVLKNMSVFLNAENVRRCAFLNTQITQFFQNNPEVTEKTLRSFKAYKLSADAVVDSEKLDEFEAALDRAFKDLLQKKSSPELLYQFRSTSVPSASQDVFAEPSSLKLSKHALSSFQEDKTLLETIELLFDGQQTIRFVDIRKLIDILRNDSCVTSSTEGHVMYRLPDIWENIALKKQVLVALPHVGKPDETDIKDANMRAELKRNFFEAGLRPKLIQTAMQAQARTKAAEGL